MDVLLSGLNTYVGTRAMSRFQESDFSVHGIIRDKISFKRKLNSPLHANLYELDLVRVGQNYHDFTLNNLDVAYYFTQVHDFSDYLTLQLEMLSLKNYINVIKKNNCNRLIYIVRLMDKKHLQTIEKLFISEDVDYTIVVKNVAIGYGSIIDSYIKKLLTFSYVPYTKSVAEIRFRPISVVDVLNFIKIIGKENRFVRQIIGLGGPEEMTFQSLFHLYVDRFSPETKFHGINISRPLLNFVHKKLYKINHEDQLEFNRLIKFEYPINNQSWSDQINFDFTPIVDAIEMQESSFSSFSV